MMASQLDRIGSLSTLENVTIGLIPQDANAVTHVPHGFVIELTYGPDVDWFRNITAAGGCVVVDRAVEYQVDRIESCSTADGLAAFGFPRALVLRLLRRREFRRLHVAVGLPEPDGI